MHETNDLSCCMKSKCREQVDIVMPQFLTIFSPILDPFSCYFLQCLPLPRYLYCDEICLEPDTVLATLYAAKKYLVPHLAQQCVKFLEVSLTARNACLLLSQSRLFEEPELMTRCWEVIDAQVCVCAVFALLVCVVCGKGFKICSFCLSSYPSHTFFSFISFFFRFSRLSRYLCLLHKYLSLATPSFPSLFDSLDCPAIYVHYTTISLLGHSFLPLLI